MISVPRFHVVTDDHVLSDSGFLSRAAEVLEEGICNSNAAWQPAWSNGRMLRYGSLSPGVIELITLFPASAGGTERHFLFRERGGASRIHSNIDIH